MSTPDEELLQLIDRILNLVGEDGAALDRWGQTADGQKVIQYVVQIGKYNTNVGEGKDIAIGDRLDRALLEDVRDLLRSQRTPSQLEIDWQQVSRSLLNEQIQRLTTNPLTHAQGIAYRTEQVNVPLGLVERKEVSRRGEDVSPEQGSLLYEETEITQKFEHGAFLEQVLRQGQSPRSGGRRIAVIGEPGAGKTTLLQQMARWVADNIEGAIAIWVSLADLQGRSLEDYLLEQWLPAAVQQQGKAEASTLVKDAFVEQVNAGRVWLWLDGVDEMAVDNPLGEIERQRKEESLLLQSRIALTCRLNMWDGNRHALDTFDVYRTLEFAYPGQVEQFVGQWFGALPEVREGQVKKLCEALRQPGNERLRDLVKNPLRLTLLCFNWYLDEGTLPETKAGLYEQFVADLYEWKRERFPTTAAQRRQLNAALGELAREAIDKEETRFRLRHDFVCKFLGEPDEPDSLFKMALKLGWLNQIGMDSGNRRKAVYAFFHPTFQEYFAVLSIEDWHFFLNHIPDNPSDLDASYQIFQPKWKEVILLWIGQNDISMIKKSAFIDALVDFDDKCEYFYSYQAYLLASCCLAEYGDYYQADKIIEELADNYFSIYDEQENCWVNCSNFIKQASKQALIESDHSKVIKALEKRLKSSSEECFCKRVALTLGIIDVGNKQAIDTLLQLIDSPGLLTWETARDLCRVSTKHEKAINTLLAQMQSHYSDSVRQQSANILGEVDPDDEKSFEVLLEILQNSQDDYIRWEAARSLGNIAVGNVFVINNLIAILDNESNTEQIKQASAMVLSQIGFDSIDAAMTLHSLLNDLDNFTKYIVAKNLVKSSTYNNIATQVLIKLVNCSIEHIRCRAAACLGRIQVSLEKIINVLSEIIQSTEDYNIYLIAAQALGEFSPNHTDLPEILIDMIKNEKDWFTRREIIDTLKVFIEYRNPEDIIIKLRDLDNESSSELLWKCSQKVSYPEFGIVK